MSSENIETNGNLLLTGKIYKVIHRGQYSGVCIYNPKEEILNIYSGKGIIKYSIGKYGNIYSQTLDLFSISHSCLVRCLSEDETYIRCKDINEFTGVDDVDGWNDLCIHNWKNYIGFRESYEFCEKCGIKKDF